MARNNTTAGSRRSGRSISAIRVKGYKSLCDDTQIELAPITLLAGANSSGKSSVMQPVLLLKQTLEAGYDPGPLLLDGPCVKFTTTEQLLSRLAGKMPATEFSVGIDLNSGMSLTTTFQHDASAGLAIREMSWREGPGRASLRPGMSHSQIARLLPDWLKAFGEAAARERKTPVEWKVLRSMCSLQVCLTLGESGNGLTHLAEPYLFSPFAFFADPVREVVYVPGFRGSPERTYNTTAVGPLFPGTFEKYVASIVAEWQASDKDKHKMLGEALKALGLTWTVRAKALDETRVELQVGRLPRAQRGGARDLVNIADVGFGVSQVLPVVVALLTARPGQTVYIEQPELHLHPRAQIQLAQLCAEAAHRGAKVVLETHSALFLLGIQTLVAEGRIAPDLVKLHWFQRASNGATRVTPGGLDEHGAFGEWPEDFGEVELHGERRYVNAVDQSYERK